MKKFLTVLPMVALLGAGCFGSSAPVAPAPPPAPPKPQITYVGCTPKAATVLEPAAGATVTLPLTVKLKVENRTQPNCHWTVFEAVAGSIRLLDKDGVTVGTGQLFTHEDWMTDGPVEFTGEIPALALVEGAATLIITEDDPSGQGNPEEIMVPLTMAR